MSAGHRCRPVLPAVTSASHSDSVYPKCALFVVLSCISNDKYRKQKGLIIGHIHGEDYNHVVFLVVIMHLRTLGVDHFVSVWHPLL